MPQRADRARAHVHDARPRFSATNEEGLEIAAAFFAASRTGDMDTLRNLLEKNVVVYADAGGRVAAPTSPATGIGAVLSLFKAPACCFVRSPSRLIR